MMCILCVCVYTLYIIVCVWVCIFKCVCSKHTGATRLNDGEGGPLENKKT